MPAAAIRPTARRLALLLLLAATLAAAPAVPALAVPAAPTAGPGTPVHLHDFGPSGSQSIFISLLWGNRLYLEAKDAVTGVELWTSDGTLTGTLALSDLTGNSVVDEIRVASNGRVFFAGAVQPVGAGPGEFVEGAAAGMCPTEDHLLEQDAGGH